MKIKNTILNIINFILLLLGNINLLGAFTLIETDILGTIFFGIISIVLCFFAYVNTKNAKKQKKYCFFYDFMLLFG